MDEHTTETGQSGLSSEEIRAHSEHDHLAAVFADRSHAVEAVDELRSLGLGSEHLGVAVHGDDAVAFEHDADTELVHDSEVGAIAGAPIGAIAGLALAALAIPGVGTIGAGGVLAVTGASALWGVLLGASFGATVGESGWIEHEDIGYTALKSGEVLVVVCSHGHPDSVREVLQRHAGQLHTIAAGTI